MEIFKNKISFPIKTLTLHKLSENENSNCEHI